MNIEKEPEMLYMENISPIKSSVETFYKRLVEEVEEQLCLKTR